MARSPATSRRSDLLWALHRLAVATAAFDARLAHRLALSPTDYLALKHLMAAADPLGPAGLAQKLGMSTGSVNALIDRLEAKGHLRRRPHPRDQRRVELEVSTSTRATVVAQLEATSETITAAASRIDAEHLARITELLDEVAAAYADAPSVRP